MIGELLGKVEGAIDSVAGQLPLGFPPDVAAAIFEGVKVQAQRLQEEPVA